MESESKKIWEELEKIKTRNKRVEKDKAWETSRTRAVFISLSSFLLIYILMKLINAEKPFLNAIIAAASYLISTFSYDILKEWWLQRNSK